MGKKESSTDGSRSPNCQDFDYDAGFPGSNSPKLHKTSSGSNLLKRMPDLKEANKNRIKTQIYNQLMREISGIFKGKACANK